MKIRIAGIENDSVVDGEGLRLTVFTQGCLHHCDGCHNPQTWDENGGYIVSTKEILDSFDANPILSGITLSGGEPFLQCKALTCLAREIHARGKNVWCYTGYTYEELLNMEDQSIRALLREIDVLVDGRFEKGKRSYDMKFRGSSNQRLIRLTLGNVVSIE